MRYFTSLEIKIKKAVYFLLALYNNFVIFKSYVFINISLKQSK